MGMGHSGLSPHMHARYVIGSGHAGGPVVQDEGQQERKLSISYRRL